MTVPPRTIERLLAGLGAKPEFRNAVLGDLAEEFASRVETDGLERATRWYRREAVRAVPHLLRSWLRDARLGDVRHIAGVIATAYTGMAVVFLLLGGVTIAVVQALGYQGPLVRLSMLESTTILSCLMVFSLVLGAVAGFLAAWLDSRAPLVTATTFGVLILLSQFVARHAFARPVPSPFPMWYLIGAPALAFIGTIAGGIIRVRASGPGNVAA
jgi:hypothetical protein